MVAGSEQFQRLITCDYGFGVNLDVMIFGRADVPELLREGERLHELIAVDLKPEAREQLNVQHRDQHPQVKLLRCVLDVLYCGDYFHVQVVALEFQRIVK